MGRYDLPSPKCKHAGRTGPSAVRVTSHNDLAGALVADEPLASVWVCDREPCIEDAKEWVVASTHREPLVYPKVKP